jgi:outer membrane protein assembly factor BamA
MGKLKTIARLLLVMCCLRPASAGPTETAQNRNTSWSVFPVLMYDTDIGVGYGGKGKIVNLFRKRESFDLMLFNSSKGERTYTFMFSWPDLELRQRTVYPVSLDIKAEYSKYLKQYYFGQGQDSSKENLTYYTDEKKELQITLGRGFSPGFVMELQYSLKNVAFFNVEAGRPFSEDLGRVGEGFSPYASAVLHFDSSDSRIHPKEGVRFTVRGDAAADWLGNGNASYRRFRLDLRAYNRVLGEQNVLALRILMEQIGGGDVPLFELPVLGGGSEYNALRGYQFGRFRDRGKLLVNGEYRFALWKRLGGNLFVDAGTVWPDWGHIRLAGLAANAGWGLRYYLANFVVRFDMGFGPEGTGIYFNFGHVF